MKKPLILAALLALAALPAFPQADKAPSAFGISLSGYVKTDIFYDSRQTVNIREGHYLLYPKGPLDDPRSRDINARAGFNMLSIQTRVAGKITGPDALGAKTSAYIETEFFGTTDGDINGLRLRHAYLKLNWPKTELMVGQFWHPMFITEDYPDVVSFNTGAPFQPFNRSPQVRLTQAFGRFSLIATALSQRDFASTGPDGVSSAYLRNAAVPELNLKAQYAAKDEAAGTEIVAGAGVDYLRLAPRIVTETGYKTDEAADAVSAMAYAKQKWPALTIKAEAVYGQNTHHLTMIGGYAVTGVPDPVTGAFSYAPLDIVSFWAEAMTNGKRWQTGVFAGYAKNLGSKHEITGAVFARGANIAALYRVSPRLVFNAGKVRFAAETEITGAAYGTPDLFGKVQDAKYVANVRVLLAAYYFL
jgi:hypothetical protein